MTKEIEVARLLNVKVNTNTGQVYLEMEVTDPVWKQKILSEWQDSTIKLVIEKNDDVKIFDAIKDIKKDEQAPLSPEDFRVIKEQIGKWNPLKLGLYDWYDCDFTNITQARFK
jgi:hypothetical protein